MNWSVRVFCFWFENKNNEKSVASRRTVRRNNIISTLMEIQIVPPSDLARSVRADDARAVAARMIRQRRAALGYGEGTWLWGAPLRHRSISVGRTPHSGFPHPPARRTANGGNAGVVVCARGQRIPRSVPRTGRVDRPTDILSEAA